MAAPALQKTWQGGSSPGGTQFVNVAVSGINPRDTLWAIKNAMVNFNTNPWTVIGSSDSVNSSMDGTDRWVTSADIVYRTTSNTPMSWIVLQQTALGATFQVVLYVEDTLAADPQRENINIVANSGGYGTANGGTDGAINGIPGVADITKNFGLIGTDWLGAENGSNTQKVLTCISSTDGECTRIIASNQATGIPVMAMGFEKPRLPPTSWTLPAVMYIFKSTTASGLSALRWEVMAANVSAENIWGSENFGAGFAATRMNLNMPMLNTIEVVDLPEEDRPNPMLYPCSLFGSPSVSQAEPALKHYGTLFDWYWCSREVTGQFLADLDTIPLAGNRTFVCVGDCVYGWLNDSATDLSYT